MTLSSVPAPAQEPGRPEPPFSSTLVEETLKLLVKAARAHQLYLHNNPTYLRALDTARAAFAPIWEVTDELAFDVTETEFRWYGETVLQEPEKATDNIPWMMYKDGIRELRLMKDFEQHELVPLLDILQRSRKVSPEEDDLLTMLWEQEFNYLRYRYIDLSTDQATPIDRAGFRGGEAGPDALRDGAPPMDASVPSVVNLDDFDSTLYFLEEREIEYLREEVRKEYAIDMRRNVVAMLLDTYETQTDPGVREEIGALLDTLMLHILSSGQFKTAAFLLRETARTAERTSGITPEQRDQLLKIRDRLSDPEVLSQILQSLDEASQLPDQEDLNELFGQLKVTALATVFTWLLKAQTPRLRVLLENTAAQLATTNTAELVRLIGSSDREVAREAVRRAGAVRATAAVGALAKLTTDADVQMRLAAVQALGEIASPGALQFLERTIEDPHRDVRVATARAIAARAHRAALPKIEAVVKGKLARDADLTEKMALFEAYGTLCGEAGVSLLDGMLNARGLFGKKEDPELRACAAMALGRIGSEAAIATLRRASTEKDILVRNAVNRALRGGTA
ncbi:MAG TPA: HEAT repeat domain-containing protein [Gemmatimonadaceae bacterium]|nr:HEAT repeat domain-containing protein [Gemmatimonadaceae bacterium]